LDVGIFRQGLSSSYYITVLNEVKENMLLTDVVKNPQRKRKYKKRTKWKF